VNVLLVGSAARLARALWIHLPINAKQAFSAWQEQYRATIAETLALRLKVSRLHLHQQLLQLLKSFRMALALSSTTVQYLAVKVSHAYQVLIVMQPAAMIPASVQIQ